jgi:glycosyltransferase involved in cell wall biosynthesis
MLMGPSCHTVPVSAPRLANAFALRAGWRGSAEPAYDAPTMNAPVTAPDPTASIVAALHRVSPRFTRPPVSLRSVTIYGAVLALWIALTVGAWFASGLYAWSTGIAYVLYDTWLLVYVACKTAYLWRIPAADGAPALAPTGERAGSPTGAPAGALTLAPASAPTGTLAGTPAGSLAGAAAPPPRIGIIIAAYNEAPALPTTLDALLPQLEAGDELWVVDDGSEDDTGRMLAARFGIEWPAQGTLGRSRRHPGLNVWRARHGGKARALNAALARLRTEVILTVDADTKLAPDALGAVRSAFAAEPHLVAACCVLRPVCAPGLVSGLFQWFQTYEYMRAFCSRIAWMRSDALLLVSGAFAGFRREALLVVGGFDPACLVEDYELIHRLYRFSMDRGLDWRVRVLPAPRAITDAPGTLPSFLKQRRRWFAGFLQTQYWNCDMTCNGRYGSVGRWMLPIKALDTMQPVFGLTAFALLLGFAAAGRLKILVPVLLVILAKIVIDIGFHLWWVKVYARWTGQRTPRGGFLLALLAALAEPFSFQLLRHVGAVWGWVGFLTRHHAWGVTPSLPALEARPE